MGEFITVPIELAKPSENCLSKNKLEKIMDAYCSFSRHLLPPIAVVAYNGEYWLLDGHHRTVVEVFLGAEQLRVYRADHREDILDWLSFPEMMQDRICEINQNI